LDHSIAAFKIHVRPIVESYCFAICNPCTVKDVTAIEKVQKLFTKQLPGMKHI